VKGKLDLRDLSYFHFQRFYINVEDEERNPVRVSEWEMKDFVGLVLALSFFVDVFGRQVWGLDKN